MKAVLVCAAFIAAIQLISGGPLHLSKRAAFYIANETACVVDSIVYYNGEPIPTDDPCEACKCRPPGFACVLKDCESKPGCRAVRKVGHCCPEYICDSLSNDAPSEDNVIPSERSDEDFSPVSTSKPSELTGNPEPTAHAVEEDTSKAENRELVDTPEPTTRQAEILEVTSEVASKAPHSDDQESRSDEDLTTNEDVKLDQDDRVVADSEIISETKKPLELPTGSPLVTTEDKETKNPTKLPVLLKSNFEIINKDESAEAAEVSSESATVKAEKSTDDNKEQSVPISTNALEEHEDVIKDPSPLDKEDVSVPTKSEDASITPVSVAKFVENSAADHSKNLKFPEDDVTSESDIKSTTLAESVPNTSSAQVVSEVPTTILSVESRSDESSTEDKSPISAQDPESSTQKDQMSSESLTTEKSDKENLKPDAAPKKEVVLNFATDRIQKEEVGSAELSTASQEETQKQTTQNPISNVTDEKSSIDDTIIKEQPTLFKSLNEVIKPEETLTSHVEKTSSQATTEVTPKDAAPEPTTISSSTAKDEVKTSEHFPTEQDTVKPKARLEDPETTNASPPQNLENKTTSKSHELKDTTMPVENLERSTTIVVAETKKDDLVIDVTTAASTMEKSLN